MPTSLKMHGKNRVTAELLQQHCPAGRILDLPCGSGALSQHLQQAGYEILAADLDQGELKCDGIPYQKLDMDTRLPFDDESFGGVCCVAGLEHTMNPYFTLTEFHRILKPGGVAVVQIPNFGSLTRRFRFLVWGMMSHEHGFAVDSHGDKQPVGHISCPVPTQLRRLVEAARFEAMDLRYFHPHRRTAIFAFPLWAPLAAFGLLGARHSRKHTREECFSLSQWFSRQVVIVGQKKG